MAIDDLANSIVDTKTEVSLLDSKLLNLDSRISKELCTVKEVLKEIFDVILRRQGEGVKLTRQQTQKDEVSVANRFENLILRFLN
jgi:hypothetical protein